MQEVLRGGGGQGVRQEVVRRVRLGMYNIQNGRNRVLDSALRGISQVNVDMGVFQETNNVKGIHTQDSCGYWVMVQEVLSAHSGVVAV